MVPRNRCQEWSGRGEENHPSATKDARAQWTEGAGPDDWTHVGIVWSGAWAAPGQSAGRLG